MIGLRSAGQFLAGVALCSIISLVAQASDDTDSRRIEQQREIFRSVFSAVERGSWVAVESLSVADRSLLEEYVLWPDLRATWLKASLDSASAAEIESFVDRHANLRPARELRYRYALNRVADDDLPGYLRLYEQYYQDQGIAKLDCLAAQAEISAGRHERVRNRGLELWLIGRSQVSECDAVFEYLREHDVLTVDAYQQRFELAINEGNFSLARWLAKKLDADYQATAENWLDAQSEPQDFLRSDRLGANDEVLREQLIYAIRQLSYREPAVAHEHWRQMSAQHTFLENQILETEQHIALWAARNNSTEAYAWLQGLPAAAQNDEVLRWKARVSLRESSWDRLLNDIGLMQTSEQNSEEWRYWTAIAQHESGQLEDARTVLEELKNERSFYGFLAADRLNENYAFDHLNLAADDNRLSGLESQSELIRARELFYVGQDGRGRSEWDAAVRPLSDEDKMQAAILAHRWGWHSRAIATAASLRHYDDLSIRYPLPYKENFETYSSQANISPTWAYSVARSESLFMRDIRSSAGAIGLMQLMPATGRDVAREIQLPYSGLATLVDPTSNIRLGTRYLGKMASRYGGNKVIATAAYNAGPGRVDSWLPVDGEVDASVWIENIPFNQTREYVKRVLSAEVIFHWRMTGKTRRLTDDLSLVRSSSTAGKVAGR